jgi:hypothetical protein
MALGARLLTVAGKMQTTKNAEFHESGPGI